MRAAIEEGNCRRHLHSSAGWSECPSSCSISRRAAARRDVFCNSPSAYEAVERRGGRPIGREHRYRQYDERREGDDPTEAGRASGGRTGDDRETVSVIAHEQPSITESLKVSADDGTARPRPRNRSRPRLCGDAEIIEERHHRMRRVERAAAGPSGTMTSKSWKRADPPRRRSIAGSHAGPSSGSGDVPEPLVMDLAPSISAASSISAFNALETRDVEHHVEAEIFPTGSRSAQREKAQSDAPEQVCTAGARGGS